MKKILLINPPFYRLMGSHFNGLSLGLLYISSVLKNSGYESNVYNADFLDGKSYLNQEEIFHNYMEYKRNLNNSEHAIWKEIKSKIEETSPDVVGISMHTGTYKSVKNIAAIAKCVSRDIAVIVGGPHPTLDPEGVLHNDPNIDLAVRGEGEHTFMELIRGKDKENILGLSYKKGSRVINNPDRPFIEDLDELPFPNREAVIDADKHDLASIITGRGCPFLCSYCASPQLWNRKVRFRSAENVILELAEIEDEIRDRILYFSDDTFTINKERTKKICEKMISAGLKIKWKCDTRVDALDTELINVMKKAGCVRIKIGVESGSDRILTKINKGFNKDVIRKGVRLIKDQGVPITIYLMAGFPGETAEDLIETVKFAEELDVDYHSVSIFAPYFGTQIYRELEQAGKLFNRSHWECFFHQSRDMAVNDRINNKVLDELFRLNEKKGKKIRI